MTQYIIYTDFDKNQTLSDFFTLLQKYHAIFDGLSLHKPFDQNGNPIGQIRFSKFSHAKQYTIDHNLPLTEIITDKK